MKKFITMILICANSLIALYAQEQVSLTRENMSILYRNAQKAERAGDYESAVKIYKSILFVDAEQPVPYLKIANIYANNSEILDTVKIAVAMYEKYLLLFPNSKERETVIRKIAELRQWIVEKQKNPVNLTAVMENTNSESVVNANTEQIDVDAEQTETKQIDEDAGQADEDMEQIDEDTEQTDEDMEQIDEDDSQQKLEYYINTGNRYYASGEYEKAIENYLEATKIYEFADIYSTLCLAYCAIEYKYAAKAAYKKYVKLAPGGEDIEKLKQALKIFDPVKVDWTEIEYQSTSRFWNINYRYIPFFPIHYNHQKYTGIVLHGVSISVMQEGDLPIKAELDFAFNWGKISENLYPTGITSYSAWGDLGDNLFNIDFKIKGRYFSDCPHFQIGKNIVGRITGSLGGGFGHLSHAENVLIDLYTPKEDETLSDLFFYIINNLSYEASTGVYLSRRDRPNGFKIELYTSGYWQFKSQYKMLGPHLGIQIGFTFGVPD